MLDLGFVARSRVRLVRQTEIAECGLASLAMVANYHGLDIDLEADYDRTAAILEDEDSDESEFAKAEEELVSIDRAMRDLNDRPPVLADELKSEAGAFLVLSRNGEPALVPQFYTEVEVVKADDGAVEPVDAGADTKRKSVALSQRLLDELSMQRRCTSSSARCSRSELRIGGGRLRRTISTVRPRCARSKRSMQRAAPNSLVAMPMQVRRRHSCQAQPSVSSPAISSARRM